MGFESSLASPDRGLKRGRLRLLTTYMLVMVLCIYHRQISSRVYIRLED